MNIKTVIVIFTFILIYSIIFWPTLYIYTNTTQNILVKINRITGESYYCTYDKWIKIKDEVVFEPTKYSLEPKEFVSYQDYIKQQAEDK